MLKVNGMSVFPQLSELEAMLGPAIPPFLGFGSDKGRQMNQARRRSPVAFVVIKPGSRR